MGLGRTGCGGPGGGGGDVGFALILPIVYDWLARARTQNTISPTRSVAARRNPRKSRRNCVSFRRQLAPRSEVSMDAGKVKRVALGGLQIVTNERLSVDRELPLAPRPEEGQEDQAQCDETADCDPGQRLDALARQDAVTEERRRDRGARHQDARAGSQLCDDPVLLLQRTLGLPPRRPAQLFRRES
jgi:hypothetical protein